MGTSAQFFINNPCDLVERKWLGCVRNDGDPEGPLNALVGVNTEQEFRDVIESLMGDRHDYTEPTRHRFPFPWEDDLFMTDFTYCLLGKLTYVSYRRKGWLLIRSYIYWPKTRRAYLKQEDRLPAGVRAPTGMTKTGHDAQMFIRA